MKGDRDRVKATFEEQSLHLPRKERKQEIVSQPPSAQSLPCSPPPPRTPSAPQERGVALAPEVPRLPWDRLGMWGGQQQTWHPKNHPVQGRGSRLLPETPQRARSCRGLPELQELPAGILEQAEHPRRLGLLIFPAPLAPFKSKASFPAPHPRNIPSDSSPFNGAAPNQNCPFYSQIIVIVLRVPGGDLTQPPGEHKKPQ